MRRVLSALQAPGNVHALLRPTQDYLYRERGWTSVRALPPLLPLAVAASPEALPPGPDTAPVIRLAGVSFSESYLLCPVLSGLQGLSAAEEGIILAAREEDLDLMALHDLPRPPETRVRQWWYLVLELEFSSSERWWIDFHWRELESRRLHKQAP